jgi:7-cyano-7-deazaguanine synthase
MESNKVVISMSGGLDSTCLALHMLAQGKEVRAYAFDYGQKHTIELNRVKSNVRFLKRKGLPISLQVINLKDVFSDSQSSLTGNGDIPQGHYEDSNMKSTVVENRNVIFSSIIYGKALSWSKLTNSNVEITLGIHAGDHTIYPDCTPESQEMARELFRISNWGSENIDYVAPFVNNTKGEVLRAGLSAMEKMGFSEKDVTYVLNHTHTCYSPNAIGESCGKCGSCTERLEAFAFCGMEDPIAYQDYTIEDYNQKIQEYYDSVVKDYDEKIVENIEYNKKFLDKLAELCEDGVPVAKFIAVLFSDDDFSESPKESYGRLIKFIDEELNEL